MKELPILFSGPMVRAILAGRKTQTRRPIKPQPIPDRYFPATRREWNPGKLHYTECNVNWSPITKAFEDFINNGHCPYGKPGCRRWVRETWAPFDAWVDGIERDDPVVVRYAADGEIIRWDANEAIRVDQDQFSMPKWRPSIYMPRWACRLKIDIAAVRAERLQDISENDAKAEGVQPGLVGNSPFGTVGVELRRESHVQAFRVAWNEIYKNEGFGWMANPWVWVVEFKRVTAR